VASLAPQALNEPSLQKVFVLIHLQGFFSKGFSITPANKRDKKDKGEKKEYFSWAMSLKQADHKGSSKHLFDHMSVDIGQSSLKSVMIIRKSLMIQSHQMKNRSVKVVHARPPLYALEPKIITLSITVSFFNPGTGKETGKCIRIVIPTRSIPLKERHPTKLGAPDYQSIF